ncbi:T9SS type A sorting domain-containing protein [Chryseobacterium sp. IHB B 17019]|uniref:T9SS type A sorting domain-containing protein n=1 Tax=Chryseobacterium sp. IHB B 17019 TaxID=1721091 RepID=UPI0009E709A1|nr:T9SS type A sorting domain-containing protein [Chryseobacterium sp. IHB B 17019]
MMKSLLLFGALTAAAVSLNAQTTIFNETFSSATPGVMPTGWTLADLDGDGFNWVPVIPPSSFDPDAMGFSGNCAYSFGFGGDNNLLISPLITLPAGSLTLTFQVGEFTSDGFLTPNSRYAVYVLPAANTYTGTETPIITETITTGDVAITKTIDISSFAGQSVKLYFRHYPTDLQTLLLDNVTITSATLGTSETGNKEQVGIYPNPATDFITIKSKSEIISTEVYDATGRKVGSQLKSDKVDVRNLLPGNYILNINTKEGKTSSKFIKKN